MACSSGSCSTRTLTAAPLHVQALPAWARRGKTAFCCDECANDALNAAGDAPVITRNPNAGNKGGLGGGAGGSEYSLDGQQVVAGLGAVGGAVGGVYGESQATERARIQAAAQIEQARINAAAAIERARIDAARAGAAGGGAAGTGYEVLTLANAGTGAAAGTGAGTGIPPRTDSGMNLDMNTWSTPQKVGGALALAGLLYGGYQFMQKKGRR